MPYGTSYTTDPGGRAQRHASTVGSLHTTFGVRQTTNETRTGFSDFFSTGDSTDKQYTRTHSSTGGLSSGYTTSIGTSQSHIFRNKTSSGTTYIWHEDVQYLTVVGTASTASGATVDVNTGTTVTTTVAPLTLVSTILSASTTWGGWTATETYEDTIYTTTGTASGLGTITREGTTAAEITDRPQSFTFVTTQAGDTVSPVTARTFRVTYPDYGGFLYVPVSSSAYVPAIATSVLATTASWTDPVEISTWSYLQFTSSSYSSIGTVAVTSMFSSTTWGGSAQITQQYMEPVLRQYSTRTASAWGVNPVTQNSQVTLSISTQISAPWFATTRTSYSAANTSAQTVWASVITGTFTSMSNLGWTTREAAFPLYGISTLSYPVSVDEGAFATFANMLAGTVTAVRTLSPWRVAGFLRTHGTTNGFAPVPGNAATPPDLDMSPATAWGMGLTGIPATWTSAGRAFEYSTANSEGWPVLVPIAGKPYTRFGTPIRTMYHGSIDTAGATISRTLSNLTQSTLTTDQTSFVWQTLSAHSSFYFGARRIHYHAPATHYHDEHALIEMSEGTYRTIGHGSIVATAGESIRITPIPRFTVSAGFGNVTPLMTTP